MRAMLGMLGVLAVTGLGLFSSNAKADERYRASAEYGPTTYVVQVAHRDRDDRRFDFRRDRDHDRDWRRGDRDREGYRGWDHDRDRGDWRR